ncbi:MAG: FHA domain-containing protein [Actinobacteria bacterium]|nr:FHA domain-containing protein [Actinomycetota bacterium]
MTSAESERLARDAYEAYRAAHPAAAPEWEDIPEQERAAWQAAVSAVAARRRETTSIEAVPSPSLLIRSANHSRTFDAQFTVGRQGDLAIDDEFASGYHARFRVAHGNWYVEDLGSTNGTWLNGRRIQAAQWLKKGDKIRIGHTVMTVEPA